MTRNEWIAETARAYRVHGRWGTPSVNCLETFPSFADALEAAREDALTLEATTLAPWQSAPPLTDAAANVVEAAVAWEDGVSKAIALHPVMLNIDDQKLIAAVRAYKESVK